MASSVKWQVALAGALTAAVLTLAAFPNPAFADVRVTGDLGGEVTSYIRKFQEIRESGERLVIDGPCLSACTLFAAFVPPDQVCVTRRAVLGFHGATLYDDARHRLVPTRRGTALVMHVYPPEIRNWIARHGGLTQRIIMMRGHDLAALFRTCQ
jgi:hypothetical protein